ncbi:MAG: aminopeptidase P family protein, partial [Acidobacteria bacterium]|nr:aminopeptidase P family protein [Acidobacteriota bacterium]
MKTLLRGMKRVAMEYSPGNAIPYVSRVDAGTVEAVRELGVDVVSSGDLIQRFEAIWSDEALA